MRLKAKWTIDSEAIRVRGMIVLVKSIVTIVLVSKPALFTTSGL